MRNFLTPLASAIILICFFSPWMSCGSLTVSGYDIASGTDRGEAVSTNSDSGSPVLWVVPVSAILIAAASVSKRSSTRVIIPAAAIISLIVMAVKGFDIKDKWSDSVHVLWGFWLTVVALLACILDAASKPRIGE